MAIGTLLTRFQENAHRIGHSIEILAYVERPGGTLATLA
jgi:hypothetical protein